MSVPNLQTITRGFYPVKILLIIILYFLFQGAKGQIFDTLALSKKKEFIHQLMSLKQYDDAVYLIERSNSDLQNDSLILTRTKALLFQRKEKYVVVDTFRSDLKDPLRGSCSYRLMQNHAHLMLGNYDSIKDPECSIHLLHKEQWKIQLMAAMLFQKKWDDFEMIFNSGKCTDPVCSVAEFALYVQKQKLMYLKTKKRFLAGLFSAIIPGTGKIYAGKPREAFYSFFPVVVNFAQAAEGYYYNKLESPHLYVFGAVGTVFYASNIYGSARAAKRKNEENDFKNNNNIAFEIYKLIKYY